MSYMADFSGKESHIKHIHPVLRWIMFEADYYCYQMNKPYVVTSIIRGVKDGISKSKTHQTGRAFDVSVKGWSETFIEMFINYLNAMFSSYAATSASGEKRLAVRHNSGHGDHIHIQINSKYSLDLSGVNL